MSIFQIIALIIGLGAGLFLFLAWIGDDDDYLDEVEPQDEEYEL